MVSNLPTAFYVADVAALSNVISSFGRPPQHRAWWLYRAKRRSRRDHAKNLQAKNGKRLLIAPEERIAQVRVRLSSLTSGWKF